MKKIALFLFSLFLCFTAGFSIARFRPEIAELFIKDFTCHRKNSFQKFKPTLYPSQNHPFVILIIGENNGAFSEKTIQSALSQKYENFRIIYIDNASIDGSFEHAQDIVYKNDRCYRVHLIKDEEPLSEIQNILNAVQSCQDEEIIVLLNGEDLLSHEWVLQTLNQYYANPNLWMTVSLYREFPSFEMGESLVFNKNLRESSFPSLHLKTFYAALFKQIRETDFTSDANELTYLIPLLEMAKDHFQSIPEILYLRTRIPSKDPLKEGLCAQNIQPYEPLSKLFNKKGK